MTKKIEAIIREEKLDEVKNALREIGIVGLNVIEVHGHGRQGGIELAGRTGSYHVDMLPKIQINIVLSDHNVEKTIETICQAARTGQTGDGIIFVYPVDDVIRIRTGERGREALTYTDDIDARRVKKNGVKV
jgi:nitrogen regulatory protein P-II 1